MSESHSELTELRELPPMLTSTAVLPSSLFLMVTPQCSMVGPRNQQASPNHLRNPEAAGPRD